MVIDEEDGGIVDGAHTAKIIEQCNLQKTTHPDQYVEVYIRTGVEDDLGQLAHEDAATCAARTTRSTKSEKLDSTKGCPARSRTLRMCGLFQASAS